MNRRSLELAIARIERLARSGQRTGETLDEIARAARAVLPTDREEARRRRAQRVLERREGRRLARALVRLAAEDTLARVFVERARARRRAGLEDERPPRRAANGFLEQLVERAGAGHAARRRHETSVRVQDATSVYVRRGGEWLHQSAPPQSFAIEPAEDGTTLAIRDGYVFLYPRGSGA